MRKLRDTIGDIVRTMRQHTPSDDLSGGRETSLPDRALKDLLNAAVELRDKAKNLPFENYVLQRLYFASIHTREDTVEDAEPSTYSWLPTISTVEDAETSTYSGLPLFSTLYAEEWLPRFRTVEDAEPWTDNCVVTIETADPWTDSLPPATPSRAAQSSQLASPKILDDSIFDPFIPGELREELADFLQTVCGERYDIESFVVSDLESLDKWTIFQRFLSLRALPTFRRYHPLRRPMNQPEHRSGGALVTHKPHHSSSGLFKPAFKLGSTHSGGKHGDGNGEPFSCDSPRGLASGDSTSAPLVSEVETVVHHDGGERDEEGEDVSYDGDDYDDGDTSGTASDIDGWDGSENDAASHGDYYSSEDDDIDTITRMKQASEGLMRFLRTGNGVFFICGKAGCGKSNLMKFLANNSRIREALQHWAGRKKPVVVPIYLWRSGHDLQMSLEGLYRSLLFGIIQQCPEMATKAFRNAVPDFESDDSLNRTFRLAELKSAVSSLMGLSAFPKHRLCLFIDGLDEFEGESFEHLQLARTLKSWAASGDVKIVCSARPYHEFLDTLVSPNKVMQLHELNATDIHRFLVGNLRRESKLSRSRLPWPALMQLVKRIVELSDGVFLWARLVLRSIIQGITHEDSMGELWRRLDSMPRDLHKLYSSMLHDVDETHRSRTETMLRLAIGVPWGERLSALEYSWVEDLGDSTFPFALPHRTYSDREVKRRRRRVRRQLSLLTKGLLEVRRASREGSTSAHSRYVVEFFHRTARDFVKERLSSEKDNRSESTSSHLDHDAFRIWVARLKTFPREPACSFLRRPFDWLLANRNYSLPFEVLQELGKIVDSYPGAPDLPSKGPQRSALLPMLMREVLCSQPERVSSLTTRSLSTPGESSGVEDSAKEVDIPSGLYIALYYVQPAYVVGQLTRGVGADVGNERLGRWLLSATTSPRHDAELAGHLFSHGIRPQSLVLVRQAVRSGLLLLSKVPTEMHAVSIWSVFLRCFAERCLSNKRLTPTAELEPMMELMRLYMLYGADAKVLFYCHQSSMTSMNTMIDEHYVMRDTSIFHLPLDQLLRVIDSPTSREIEGTLRAKQGTNGVANRACPGPVGSYRELWDRVSADVKQITRGEFRSIDDKYIKQENWVVWGVLTETGELCGDFTIDLV